MWNITRPQRPCEEEQEYFLPFGLRRLRDLEKKGPCRIEEKSGQGFRRPSPLHICTISHRIVSMYNSSD